MSKYRQPNSKRKQKQRAKRLKREMCESILHHSGSYEDTCALTPEEFCMLEAKESFIPQEEVRVRRKRKHSEPRQVTAAA